MNAKEAQIIYTKHYSTFRGICQDSMICAKADGYIEALMGPEVGKLLDALNDIEKFHTYEIEKLDEKYGWLGWTCCGQKGNLAKSALEQFKKAGGESK